MATYLCHRAAGMAMTIAILLGRNKPVKSDAPSDCSLFNLLNTLSGTCVDTNVKESTKAGWVWHSLTACLTVGFKCLFGSYPDELSQ